MAKNVTARVPVTGNTLEALRHLKRGGESWDSLVRRLILHSRQGEFKTYWDLTPGEKEFVDEDDIKEERMVTSNAS